MLRVIHARNILMNKVQSKRLLNVARALREAHAAKKKFNMDKFVFGQASAINYGDRFLVGQPRNVEAESCGTPACALGHYASRTDLQRFVKIQYHKDDFGIKYAELAYFGSRDSGVDYCDSEFERHFGISLEETELLFSWDGCNGAKTALAAAKYIERFVKQKTRTTRKVRS